MVPPGAPDVPDVPEVPEVPGSPDAPVVAGDEQSSTEVVMVISVRKTPVPQSQEVL